MNSTFIFDLAEKHGILLGSDKPFEFTDDQYDKFCAEYLKSANSRDVHLVDYLNNSTKLFRTFLPWRSSLFYTILQTLWYYDEIIIYDPIVFEITQFKGQNNEDNKSKLVEVLRTLNRFKESIESGFLLFAGYQTVQDQKAEAKVVDSTKLIENLDIRNELDKLVSVFKMESKSNEGTLNYNIRTMYRGKQTFHPIIVPDENKPNAPRMHSWTFDFVGSKHTPLSIEEVTKEGLYSSIFDGYIKDYPEEIKDVLDYLYIGNGLNTAVQFDRKLDDLVLQNLNLVDNNLAKKPQSFYELSLPTVDGIPPERLLEIRHEMPDAFLDYRNQMVEIIYDLSTQEYDQTILEVKLNNKINPIIKKLDGEMKNSLRKAKILGTGIPIVSAVGAFGLWQAGLDITKLGSLIWGGAGIPAEMKILTDRLSDKNKAMSNPFYYLWNVKQKK